jgi:putative ABC transport system permease protein
VTRVRVLMSRLLDLLLRRQRESRLSEEIQTHLDQLTEQYIAQGMTAGAARAEARRSFGGVDQVKESYRDQRGFPLAGTIAQDLRFAVRMLAKDPRFAITTVVALGLGVGAVSTIFTLFNTILFRDLPFADPNRLVRVSAEAQPARRGSLTYAEYLELQQRVPAFEGILGNDPTNGGYATLVEAAADARTQDLLPPMQVRRTWLTANAFAVLGVTPVLGRGFRPEDDVPGAPSVAVLSDDFWRWRYAADPSVIGRSVTIDNVSATIVGVMPPMFKFPVITELWQPLGASPMVTGEGRHRPYFEVVARMRKDADLPQVRAQLDGAAKAIAGLALSKDKLTAFDGRLLKGIGRGGPLATQILTVLLGMAALVLIIACANVASLLLARSIARSREIAIRIAVGASRWRIVRQVLIECLVLAFAAGALGAMLSGYGAELIGSGFDMIEPGRPNARPYWANFSKDSTAYLFIAATCLVTTLAFGLGPALDMSRRGANSILKEGGRGGTRRTARWASALVTAEIALALILLTSAGLMWRTFVALYQTDLVIDVSRLTTMWVWVPARFEESPVTRREFFARVEERIVTSSRFPAATISSANVVGAPGWNRELAIAGRPKPAGEAPRVQFVSVGDRFFETVRLPIVLGRALRPADGDAGREGVVVNERVVELFFANDNPIGQRIQLFQPSAKDVTFPWLTIVGVARTVPSGSANNQFQPLVYQPLRVDPIPPRSVTITVGDMTLAAAASAAREEMRALDPGLAVSGIESLDTAAARGGGAQQLLGTWLGILALVGLVLSSLGVYALAAHHVAQRTQEIGVRMALGSPLGRVIWLFLRRSLTQLAVGVALGMFGALSVGKLFASFLLHAGARDLGTTAVVTALLILITTAASLLPARRAARVDPLVALRHE